MTLAVKTSGWIVGLGLLLGWFDVSAQTIGPAEALLVKRRVETSAKNQLRGDTLFEVRENEARRLRSDETVVWRRETFGRLMPGNPAGARPSSADNRASAWQEVFVFLREYARQAEDGQLLEAEPDFPAYGARGETESSSVPTNSAAALAVSDQSLQAGAPPRPYWPVFSGLNGYLSDEYSELASAAKTVAQSRAEGAHLPPARIALLDVGFLRYHAAFPENAVLPLIDVASPRRPQTTGDSGEPWFPPHDGLNGPAHGTATAALLAGPARTIAGAGTLTHIAGGNPAAKVVPIRIGPSVAVLPFMSRTGDVAVGFDRAAAARVDVLSMSVGGPPSGALRNAVNNAYLAGVAMFCAAGDFLYWPSGLKTPWQIVYPAAYDNVMAVTGVTAEGRPYGLPPTGDWSATSKLVLGSFGPEEKMRRAIAAWGPNVPWAQLPPANELTGNGTPGRSPWDRPAATWNLVDLDGGGTSANTPQVAAAASLLIEYRGDRLASYREPWRKVEAIYQVLQASAAPVPREQQVFFGAGWLKARNALEYKDWPAAEALRSYRAKNGFYWLGLLLSAVRPLPPYDASLPEESAKLTQAAGEAVAKILGDRLDRFTPGGGYSQAVAIALETEISQVVTSSVPLQTWSETDTSKKPAEFIHLLKNETLSPTTRDFVTRVAASHP